jgi:hypothetical protein
MTLDVNFILMFNFILTRYFWCFLKARLDNMKKQRNLWIVYLKCKVICIEALYK